MKIEVTAFSPAHREDFFSIHSAKHGCGWCSCVAWWVPTWQGWGERSAEENRRLRESLLDRGEYDGYLLYVDEKPVGWCQVGPRDRLVKLVRQFHLDPDPETWAITCFLIPPDFREKGIATQMLNGVLQDLKIRGVQKVEAYPKRGKEMDALDYWNGPETMFLKAGFEILQEDPIRPVLGRSLG